jgi:hypothetical protein
VFETPTQLVTPSKRICRCTAELRRPSKIDLQSQTATLVGKSFVPRKESFLAGLARDRVVCKVESVKRCGGRIVPGGGCPRCGKCC